MPAPRLEEVFKTSGVPTFTFVEPKEYRDLLISLRTPGRGVVIEGPSGIGKTSAVENALKKLRMDDRITKFSARRPRDVEYIDALPELGDVGVVIVDDFHKLQEETKKFLADYMKTMADEETEDTKLVIVGINMAGENLISFASDLVNRLDIIRFESNPEQKVQELLAKGEEALNVSFNVREDIVKAAQGSFYIAQMLAHELSVDSIIDVPLVTVNEGRVSRARVERLTTIGRDRIPFCVGVSRYPIVAKKERMRAPT